MKEDFNYNKKYFKEIIIMKKIYKFLSGFLAVATVLNFSNSAVSFAEPPPPGKGTGDVIKRDSALTTMNSKEYQYAVKKGLACPSYMDAVTTDAEIESEVNYGNLFIDSKLSKLSLKELTSSVYNTLTFLYCSSDPTVRTFKSNDAEREISNALDMITHCDIYGGTPPVACWDMYLVENPKFIEIYGEPKAGDINIDGEVTTDDALIVLKHTVEIECLPNKKVYQSDLNDDGELNTEDALQILKTVVGLK